MNKQYKKYLIILSTTEIIICIVVAFILIYLAQDISSHNKGILEMVAMKDTEENMREKVDNLITQIDNKRKITSEEVENIVNISIDYLLPLKEDEIFETVNSLMNRIDRMEYGAPIQLVVANNDNKAVLFSDGLKTDISDQFGEEMAREIEEQSIFFHSIIIGDSKLLLFAEQDDVDEIVKDYTYNEIHSYSYASNDYFWVNEIVNYEGGDNYAIRLIHPNLKETEGNYLSTNDTDIKGNLPYLDELSGIKQDGEIFHEYYFKNINDDEVTYKVSYAKLYEPYDWIVATGKPMNNIFTYTNELSIYSTKTVNTTMIICLGLMLVIFLVGVTVILLNHKGYQKKIESYVLNETQIDPLTGAFNRKTAEYTLTKQLKNLKLYDTTPLLMMVDIDDFKKVNDTYGHDVGDFVLKKMSQTIIETIRDSDQLFRWGGEEFIVLCSDVDKESQMKLAEKILSSIESIIFENSKGNFNITVSIGGSYFNETDDNYLQVLKRADIALYQSKKTGKNKYTSYESDL